MSNRLKCRVLPRFPARLEGEDGISVTRENGTYVIRTSPVARVHLDAPRTYYVRKDGSDSNDGLSNNVLGAFLTINAAVRKVFRSVDTGGQITTIKVGPGTYNEDVTLYPPVGGPYLGQCFLEGDITTPSNVVINGTSWAISGFGAGTDWQIRGFKITSAGVGINAHAQSWLRISEMEFGACTSTHLVADHGGTIEIYPSGYTISGGAVYHVVCSNNGYFLAGINPVVTLTGTPAFAGAFVLCQGHSHVQWSGGTFVGSATGTRYVASNGGVITAGAVNYATFFPGNSAGFVLTGGRISGLTMAACEEALNVIGALTVGAGVSFPATEVVPTDPNTLGDYEKGTWTPVLNGFATVGAVTVTANYTKIGRRVWYDFSLFAATSIAATAGASYVTGQPFTNLVSSVVGITDGSAGSKGEGLLSATQIFMPTWAATPNVILASGSHITS